MHLAPQLVVKHEDLLSVCPGDGPPGAGVRLRLLVSTEQALQVGDVGQEEALGSADQQGQPQGGEATRDTTHGSAPAAATW